MTALSANRRLRKPAGDSPLSAWTIYNGEIVYVGGMIARDYLDEIQMAANTQGLRVLGCAGLYVTNAADGETLGGVGADGVIRDVIHFNNSATYAVPRSAIGQACYVEDDNTVAGYASALVAAGIVFDVDDDGVWVDQRPAALAQAHAMRPDFLVAKTDNYECTAAIAFDGRTAFRMTKSGGLTLTLPSAVAGMRFGVQRGSATATDDVTVQCAAADKIQGFDAISAAAKAVTNTTDAISEITWWRCDDDLLWKIDKPLAKDVDAWPKNDA